MAIRVQHSWLENGGPGLKMYFLLKIGDIPASYVSLREGNLVFSKLWNWYLNVCFRRQAYEAYVHDAKNEHEKAKDERNPRPTAKLINTL